MAKAVSLPIYLATYARLHYLKKVIRSPIPIATWVRVNRVGSIRTPRGFYRPGVLVCYFCELPIFSNADFIANWRGLFSLVGTVGLF